MGGCCSNTKNKGLNNDEDQANEEVGVLLRMKDGDPGDMQASSIQLTLRCRNIRPLHGGTTGLPMMRLRGPMPIPNLPHSSNPYLVAHELSAENKEIYIGRTETKRGDSHPSFVKTLTILYKFQQVQEIKFDVFDERGQGLIPGGFGLIANQPREDELLGTCTVKLVDIINGSPFTAGLTRTMKVRQRNTGEETEVQQSAGALVITAEEVSTNEGPQFEVVMDISCRNLDSKNLFGAAGSDPFLVIGRIVEGQFQPVHRTEYHERVMGCDWKTIVIKLERLCKGNFNSWLMLEVWDYESSGRHQLIGYTRQTLATLMAHLHKEIDLINDNKRGTEVRTTSGKMPYECSGYLKINAISIDRSHSFLEFVRAGFDINLMICVDFSESSAGLHAPHFEGDERTNEYIQALKAVVQVLGQYDKDQDFPFFGFGAATDDARGDPPPSSQSPIGSIKKTLLGQEKNVKPLPLNIFPVTGDMWRQSVHGVDGLIEAYWSCLERIKPTEPTNFATCLSRAYRSISNRKDIYQILLIITDGQCDDMEATIDMIVDSSTEPMSILIIGVGCGPFEKMELLSADDRPLKSSTKAVMARDIVGFVPFQTYKDNPEELARETLKEIPRQFTSWAKQNKVTPESAKKQEKVKRDLPRVTHDDMLGAADDGNPEEMEGEKEKKEEKSGWESFSDDETGRRYYYNHSTKASVWDPPAEYRKKKGMSSVTPHHASSQVTTRLSVATVTPLDSIRPSSPSAKFPYKRLGSPASSPRSASRHKRDSFVRRVST